MSGVVSQWLMVLGYITEYGSITPLEAIRDLGVMRLSARIYDLRQREYKIVTDMVDVENRWGGLTRIARYRLEGE